VDAVLAVERKKADAVKVDAEEAVEEAVEDPVAEAPRRTTMSPTGCP
jgi:hypothetical protein